MKLWKVDIAQTVLEQGHVFVNSRATLLQEFYNTKE